MPCDQCEQLRINGVVCHETGCPKAWQGTTRECKWCGQNFVPESSRQDCCEASCYAAYYNLSFPDVEESEAMNA